MTRLPQVEGRECYPEAGRPRRGGLLWQRNFRLLWTGETISGAGTAMAAVGVPLLAVTALHASTLAVSLLNAAAYLPWLLIGLPAGAWVDRMPARRLMIACDIACALLYGSVPVFALVGWLSAPCLVAVALLAGAANVLFSTAYQTLLPAVVAPNRLVEGNAKLAGSAQAVAIAGRGLAGIALDAVGAATALLFNAFSFLASAACLLRISDVPKPPARRQATTVWAETLDGIRFVAADPYLRPLTLFAAVANLAYTGTLALVVVFLTRVVGAGPAAVGILIALSGVGGVLGAMAARPLAEKFGSARTLLATAVIGGVSGLLIPLTAPGWRLVLYVAGSGLVSAGIAAGNIIASSFRQSYCPPAMLGRVITSMRFPAYGAIPLGSILAGILGTTLGTRNGLWVILAVFASSGALLLTQEIRTSRTFPRTANYPGEGPKAATTCI